MTNRKVSLKFGKKKFTWDVIPNPVPHILRDSDKKIHGWTYYDYMDNKHRECSQERFLINHYNGCYQNGNLGCDFCYTRTMRGYFHLFWDKGVSTVFKNYDQKVMNQLSKLYVAFPLYLSPITDPFMDLEKKYHYTKSIIQKALKLNIPSEFITKMGGNILKWKGYKSLIKKMSEHRYCFGQFTIYANEEIRKCFSSGSSSVREQFRAVKLCADNNLFTVVRIDPIIPYISDSEEDLESIVRRAKNNGAENFSSEENYKLYKKKFGRNAIFFLEETLYFLVGLKQL